MNEVEAPWGFFCEYLYQMSATLDAIHRPWVVQEYLAVSPATFDEWWRCMQSGNLAQEFWISEGIEERVIS